MRSQKKLLVAVTLLLSACTIVPVVPSLTVGTSGAALAQDTNKAGFDELVDQYLFTGDNESLSAKNRARIAGQRGSLVELRDGGILNLVAGTVTVTTSSAPLKVITQSCVVVVSPRSRVTIRNSNGVVVSVNEKGAGEIVSMTDGAVSKTQLHSGETYPSGAEHLAPVVSRGFKSPLLVVGTGDLQLSGSAGNTPSVVAGEFLFCPSHNLKVITPQGAVTANGHSRFLVSVAPDYVRVFNCRTGTVKFNCDRNYRRITPFEEFTLFDHRPTKEEVLPADGIARKEVILHDIDKVKTTAATDTFSIVSLLTSPFYLGDWKRRSAFDKRLENTFIKAAAACDGAKPGGQAFYQTPVMGREK